MKNTKHTYKQESLSGIQDVKNRNQITKIIEQMDNPIGCEVGVIDAVDEFVNNLKTSNQPVDLYITPCGWPSWFFIKV